MGLAVCMAEDRGFVEGINPDGSVAQWNSGVAPAMQICLGDRIDGFKVKGQGMKKLIKGNEFLNAKKMRKRAVVLQFTKPSIHTVKAKLPYGLGWKRRLNSDKTFFVVGEVYPEGSIQQWNEKFPDSQVSIGDIVRGVNGVKGSASEVKKMMADDPDEEKELLIFHYPDILDMD